MKKLLLYCTKEKNKFDILLPDEYYGKYLYHCPYENFYYQKLNGEIVGICECDKVEEITCYSGYKTKSLSTEKLYERTCLDSIDMHRYLKMENGYALYLKNVYLFDSPKQLKDFQIKRAPQNMMHVYDSDGNKYILISIKPKHLKNIINGKKTIEVRKKILNDLKELISND